VTPVLLSARPASLGREALLAELDRLLVEDDTDRWVVAHTETHSWGAKDDLVLRLAPKQASAQYQNLYLVVSPKDFHVSQSVIVDSPGNVNHFQFSPPDFETTIADATFELDERSVKDYRESMSCASRYG
jgi:outer membrane lipoprotein-sorting protein